MCDAAGELAHGFHLLGLPQGFLRLLALRHRGTDALLQGSVQQPQLVLRRLLAIDIDGGAEPAGHLAGRRVFRRRSVPLVKRVGPGDEPAVTAVAPAHPQLDVVELAALPRFAPGRLDRVAVFRMNGVPPSQRQGAFGSLAGIVVPAVAQVAERSVRIAEPDGGRRQIHQHAETSLALLQLLLRPGVLDGGPGAVGDLADENELFRHPCARALVLDPEDGRYPARFRDRGAGEGPGPMRPVCPGVRYGARVRCDVRYRHDLTGLQIVGEVAPEVFRLRDRAAVRMDYGDTILALADLTVADVGRGQRLRQDIGRRPRDLRKLGQVAQAVAELEQGLVPAFGPLAVGDFQEQHRYPLVAGLPRPRFVPAVGQGRDEHLETLRFAGVDDAFVMLDQFDRNVGNHFKDRAAHGVGSGDAGKGAEGWIDLDEAEVAHPAVGVAQRLPDVEAFLHALEQAAPARLAVAQPALALDLTRRFRAGAEHPGDAAQLVPDGTVGEGEPGFLGIAVAQHHQRQILVESRFSGQRAVDQGTDIVPNFRPHLGEGPAERLRVLGSEDRQIGVVVQECQFRSPGDEHRELGIEQKADDGAERLRPGLRTAERQIRPVVRAHQRAHDAAARQEPGIRSAVCSAVRFESGRRLVLALRQGAELPPPIGRVAMDLDLSWIEG